MLYFTSQNAITKVERQVYTGSKSTYTTVSAFTPTGYLRPMSEEQASLNGMQWGQAFQLITESGVDIRKGDRITTGGVVYLVRGVADHNRGGVTAYKKYTLTFPEA